MCHRDDPYGHKTSGDEIRISNTKYIPRVSVGTRHTSFPSKHTEYRRLQFMGNIGKKKLVESLAVIRLCDIEKSTYIILRIKLDGRSMNL